MKILHIITHYYPHVYGAENFAQHLAEHQYKHGNEVIVITGRWQKTWKAHERVNGVTVFRVGVNKWRYLQTILAVFPFTVKALALRKKYQFDVVHTHIYPGMIVGAILKWVKSAPWWIATIQGGDIGDYEEVYGPFKPLAKPLIAWCLQQADVVHCVSRHLAQTVVSMGVKKDRVVVVPNGTDIGKLEIKNFQSKTRSKIRLVSTSRLEPKNNLELLIEVVQQLRQKHYDISLDIYGTGYLYQTLETKIRQLEITDSIQLKGYISQEKLKQILSRYDLFVRLSTQEGFGISFIEAMSAGVVSVGTTVGGILDIIEDRKNGYLILLKPQNSKPQNMDITTQFENILQDKHHWSRLARQARKTVEEKFTWSHVYAQVDTLYKKNEKKL